MSWRLSSGVNDTVALDLHVEVLFQRLHTKSDALQSLTPRNRTAIGKNPSVILKYKR